MDSFNLALATGALSALLVVVFAFRRFDKIYPVFFWYSVFDLVMTSSPYWPASERSIGQITAALWVFQWFFYFLLVLELVDRILTDHPGLAKVGRRVIQAVMVAAALGAIYSLQLDSFTGIELNPTMRLFLQAERVVAGCLLLFLLLLNGFLWFFPVRLSRNTKAYLWGFTLFFAVKSAAPALINLIGYSAVQEADKIHLGGVVLCQLMWTVAITQKGAARTPAFPRSWTSSDQQKALATLEAFDHQISGAGRR